MKIVIPGGSGQVGTVLAEAFHRDGHEVVVLSRQAIARPRRHLRHARHARPARPWWDDRRRPSIHVVDSLRRSHLRDPLADRSRRHRRRRQSRVAQSPAKRRLHASASGGVRRLVRVTHEKAHAGNWCDLHADRTGTRLEKPAGRADAAARERLRVQVPFVDECGEALSRRSPASSSARTANPNGTRIQLQRSDNCRS